MKNDDMAFQWSLLLNKIKKAYLGYHMISSFFHHFPNCVDKYWCGPNVSTNDSSNLQHMSIEMLIHQLPRRRRRREKRWELLYIQQVQVVSADYIIWCNIVWYEIIYSDNSIYSLIKFDIVWYDMIWYDMKWYDMIWYDMIWCISPHSSTSQFSDGVMFDAQLGKVGRVTRGWRVQLFQGMGRTSWDPQAFHVAATLGYTCTYIYASICMYIRIFICINLYVCIYNIHT